MSTTPNLGLALPAHGAQNWDSPLNNNFDIIDGVVGGGNSGAVLTSQGSGHAPIYVTQPIPVYNETPVGTINGTTGSDGNAVFTLQNNPNPAGSLVLIKNGQELLVGTAYTLSANQITYLAPYIPVSGDVHWCRYTK